MMRPLRAAAGLVALCLILFALAAPASAGTADVTVTFNTAGGSELPAATVPAGQPVGQPEPPVKAGYVFDTWLLDGYPYDFAAAVERDITLTARWTELAFVDHIGEDGRLNGPASRWLGLSGAYDTALFAAEAGEQYPSIRLVLRDDPTCYVEFSNPAVFDLPTATTQETQVLGGIARRLHNRGPFGPLRLIENLQFDIDLTAEDALPEAFGSTYTLHRAAGEHAWRIDRFTRFENSVGLASFALPDGPDDARLALLEAAAAAVTCREGERPSIAFARLINTAVDKDAPFDRLRWFDRADACFTADALDRRLNVELLGDLTKVLGDLTLQFESVVYFARAEGGSESAEAKAHLETLGSYPFISYTDEPDATGIPLLSIYIQPYALAARYLDVLPPAYAFCAELETAHGELLRSFNPTRDLQSDRWLPYLDVLLPVADTIGRGIGYDDPYTQALLRPLLVAQEALFWGQIEAGGNVAAETIRAAAEHLGAAAPERSEVRLSLELVFRAMLNAIEQNGGQPLGLDALDRWFDTAYYYPWPQGAAAAN